MDVSPGKIDVHIDRLVLDGFQSVDQTLLAAVIQRELAQLVARENLPGSWNENARIPSIDGGTSAVTATGNVAAIGTHIAQVLHKGLTE